MSSVLNEPEQSISQRTCPWSETWFEDWAKDRPAELREELMKTESEAQKVNIQYTIELYENGTFPPPLGTLVYIQGGKIVKTYKPNGKAEGEIEVGTVDDPKPVWGEGSSIELMNIAINPPDMQSTESYIIPSHVANGYAGMNNGPHRAQYLQTRERNGRGHKVRLKPDQCRPAFPGQHIPELVLGTDFVFDTASSSLNLNSRDIRALGLGQLMPNGQIMTHFQYQSLVAPKPSMTLNGIVWKHYMEVDCRLMTSSDRNAGVVVDWFTEKCTITPDLSYQLRVTGAKMRDLAYIVLVPVTDTMMISPHKNLIINWLNTPGL